MEYLVGVGVAGLVCVFAMLSGFDRDRAFYATLVVVVAHYYILFAVLGRSQSALFAESVAAILFVAIAVIGFKRNSWLLVAGLVGHGVFDFFHHHLIQNPGVPSYWPGFCLSFDILAGGILAMLLIRRAHRAAG
jgi:hypothetical protein